MAQPFRIIKNKKALFAESMFQFQAVNYTSTVLRKDDTVKVNASAEDLRKFCKQGRLKEASEVLHIMDNQPIDPVIYARFIQLCIEKKAFSDAKLAHTHMKDRGSIPDKVLGNILVNMYAKCGSLVDVRRVFDAMPDRDARTWTAMIAAYSRHGPFEEALALFYQMQN